MEFNFHFQVKLFGQKVNCVTHYYRFHGDMFLFFVSFEGQVARVEGGIRGGEMNGIGIHDMKFTKTNKKVFLFVWLVGLFCFPRQEFLCVALAVLELTL